MGLDINISDGHLTLLHICVISNQIATFELLLKSGDNVNFKNNYNNMPLHLINANTFSKIVER